MRHRQGPQGFGGHRPPIGQHRQLATLGGDDLTLHEDVIAQVDQGLPLVEGLLAHIGQGEHRLDLGAIAGPQGREAQLAGVAHEHHPTSDADDNRGLGIHRQVRELGSHRRDRMRDRERNGVGITTLFAEPGALVKTNAHLLGQVELLVVVSGHDRQG